MSLSVLVPESFNDEAAYHAAGFAHEAAPIGPEGITSLLLRYEDLFDTMPDAFELVEFAETPDGKSLYVYKAVLFFDHFGSDYQVHIRRITESLDEVAAGNFFGYTIEIFSPVETIDENYRQYQSQKFDILAEPQTVTTTVTSRTYLEKNGLLIPDANEAQFNEAIRAYFETHEHPDNPVDAEAFHQQAHRDLITIADDILDKRVAFDNAVGRDSVTPPHITPAIQKQLETFAAFLEGFAAY